MHNTYSAPSYDSYSQPHQPSHQAIAPSALLHQQHQQQQYIPPPPPPPTTEGPLAVFTKDQHKFCTNLLKTLKKNRSAPPFLRPVDPIMLNIPDYFRVILYPTDLGTIENKLNATGRAIATAAKNGRTFGIDYVGNGYWEGRGEGVYRTAEEFKEEVNRVWENCFKYNGAKEKNAVSAMAGAMQEVAVKGFYSMPHAPSVAVSCFF